VCTQQIKATDIILLYLRVLQ